MMPNECLGKVAFLTKADAKRAKATTRSNRPGLVLHPYKCSGCGGYHLGHSHPSLLRGA